MLALPATTETVLNGIAGNPYFLKNSSQKYLFHAKLISLE